MLGMLRGVTSSVRLARLCAQDIEFRWLVGDAPIEKSTLCDFRKNHMDALLSLSTQVLRALGQNGLLPGENLGVDGTIVRAASSLHSAKSRKRLESQKNHLEDILRKKLQEPEAGLESEEVKSLERRRQRLSKALDEMALRGLMEQKNQLTLTEPDAGVKWQKECFYAPGYNAQTVTDLDSGAIINAQIVEGGNDSGLLQPQLERARAMLAEIGMGEDANEIQSITADSAYHDTRQLDEIEKQGVQCYVPENRNANRLAPGMSPEYRAEAFAYDEQTDTMCCPRGQTMNYRKLNNSGISAVYQAPVSVCRCCPEKLKCCPKTKEGRYVSRSLYAQLLATVSERVHSDEGRRKKKSRQVACEGVFARLNGLLHWRRCKMWNRAGAKAELLWRQFTHNLMLLTGVWKPMVAIHRATR
jgi:hypothetical protein